VGLSKFKYFLSTADESKPTACCMYRDGEKVKESKNSSYYYFTGAELWIR
jgi:hypothetical protein